MIKSDHLIAKLKFYLFYFILFFSFFDPKKCVDSTAKILVGRVPETDPASFFFCLNSFQTSAMPA